MHDLRRLSSRQSSYQVTVLAPEAPATAKNPHWGARLFMHSEKQHHWAACMCVLRHNACNNAHYTIHNLLALAAPGRIHGYVARAQQQLASLAPRSPILKCLLEGSMAIVCCTLRWFLVVLQFSCLSGTGTEPSTKWWPPELERARAGPHHPGLVIAVGLVVAIIGVGVVLVHLVTCWWWWRLRSGRAVSQALGGRSLPWRAGTPGGDLFRIQLPEAGYGPRSIKYAVLKKATKGFTTMLGEGGSGRVYLAVLPDGTRLAVKKIKEGSRNPGETKPEFLAEEFLAEVSSIGQLSHKNLVPLRGWCQDHGELLLVYDYMPNGSLYNHLYDRDTSPGATAAAASGLGLDWETRLNIIKGVADALLYIHQGWKQPVIHRDVSPSNVLLDEDLNAVLGDFGLAVVMDKHNIAQSVTITAGTIGYLDPECLKTGRVDAESDTFSFGVLALEVVCGKRPIDWRRPPNESFLVPWVWSLYLEDRLPEAVDPRFRGAQGAVEVVLVGLMCSFPDPAARPAMSLVTQFLSGSIPVPRHPKAIPPAETEHYLALHTSSQLC